MLSGEYDHDVLPVPPVNCKTTVPPGQMVSLGDALILHCPHPDKGERRMRTKSGNKSGDKREGTNGCKNS